MVLNVDGVDINIPWQDDIWLEVARQRSLVPASAHPQPDCRGHLHHLQCGQWVRQLLVLMDGCLYIYSDIEPDAPATGESKEYDQIYIDIFLKEFLICHLKCPQNNPKMELKKNL